jgi:hypothetical protein
MDSERIPPQTQAPQSIPPHSPSATRPVAEPQPLARTVTYCVAAAFVPGLGHVLLRKWDRAVVFMSSIVLLFYLGLQLQARLFNPDFSDLFSTLKFIADAGAGLLYWIPWLRGVGAGDATAYTYDFGNMFIYVAGLLNMLVVIDTFDIAMGRKP